MAFSPEHRNNSDPVERKKSPGEQLELRLGRARQDEGEAWGKLFRSVKNLTFSHWVKALTAGTLIGVGAWLEGRQRLGRFFGDKGHDLLKKVVQDAFREIRKK